MKKTIVIILVSTICFISFRGQAQVTTEVANALQIALDNSTMANSITGSSAAVWVEGQGMWTGTSGVSHDNISVTSEMRFGMGSITKSFTAALCLKMQEEDLLNLDDPISTWLSTFNNVNPDVTLRQLLGHKSGIANYTDSPSFFPGVIDEPNTLWTPEEILGLIGAPIFEPGEQVSYSNTNFILTGMILEAVSSETYSELLEEKIFTPLGLDEIYVEAFETVDGIFAHPWVQGMDVFSVPRTSIGSISWAAGCLVSTPEELTNWWNAYFDDFLTENSKSQARDFQDWQGGINLGLGLMEVILNGKNYQGHGGQTIGYNSFSVFDPVKKDIITVMVNNAFGDSQLLVEDLAAALDIATSINEIRKEEFGFSFFPNPTSQNAELNINIPKSSSAQITVYDSNGMMVKNENLGHLDEGENHISILFNELTNGVYFFTISGSLLPPITQQVIIMK